MAKTKTKFSAGVSVVLGLGLALLELTGTTPPRIFIIAGLVVMCGAILYSLSDWVKGSGIGVAGFMGRAAVALALTMVGMGTFSWWILTSQPHETLETKYPWLVRKDKEQQYLEIYPLGYAIFEINSISNAVSNVQVQGGENQFAFDFTKARVLQNRPDYLEIQLPDLTQKWGCRHVGRDRRGSRFVKNLWRRARCIKPKLQRNCGQRSGS